MRLKAKLMDFALFSAVATSMEKLEKTCVIRFSPEEVQLIVTMDGLQAWSSFEAGLLFQDYAIESQNQNLIYLEVRLTNLVKALKIGMYCSSNEDGIAMKLMKYENSPCLSFFVDSVVNMRSIAIQQYVPVTVLPPRQQQAFNEPRLREQLSVYITLPKLRHLKTLFDRLKNFGENLTMQVSMKGDMLFNVHSETISTTVRYSGLEIPPLERNDDVPIDEEATRAVSIEIKKFMLFLQSHQVEPPSGIVCVIDVRMVLLIVSLNPQDAQIRYYIVILSISYFIPFFFFFFNF